MSFMTRTQAAAPGAATTAWQTRDILLAAIIGVVFGVVFAVWNGVYNTLGWLQPPFADLGYGIWLVPAVLAPLLIRKPGAATFAEVAAAGVSALLGSPWGPDTLLSGFVQGAAADLVFAMTGYRAWSPLVLGIAAVAAAVAAWLHDWAIYYADISVDVQALRLAVMAVSAVAIAAGGSLALERSLRRAGVLREPPA